MLQDGGILPPDSPLTVMLTTLFNKTDETFFCFSLVIGDFVKKNNVVEKVDLGQPFIYQCPEHKPSFGAVYSWDSRVGDHNVQFSRNDRRGISPNGGLYIMYVTQEDINVIRDRNGIRCKISGANRYYESGTLKIEKSNEDQTGKEGKPPKGEV